MEQDIRIELTLSEARNAVSAREAPEFRKYHAQIWAALRGDDRAWREGDCHERRLGCRKIRRQIARLSVEIAILTRGGPRRYGRGDLCRARRPLADLRVAAAGSTASCSARRSASVGIAKTGLTQGTLVSDTFTTLYETLMGLAIGSILGVGLGLLLWFLPAIPGVAEGFSILLNSIPKIALGPLIIIWFGSGMGSKIWLASISTFAVAMISSSAAAREVDRDLLNLFHSFQAKRWS